jgi:hypothetical protein
MVRYLAQIHDQELWWWSFVQSDVAGRLELTWWKRGSKNGRGNVVGGKNEQLSHTTCHVRHIRYHTKGIINFIILQ